MPQPANRSAIRCASPAASATAPRIAASAKPVACRKAPGGRSTRTPANSTHASRRAATGSAGPPAAACQASRARSSRSANAARLSRSARPGGSGCGQQQVEAAHGGRVRLASAAGRREPREQLPERRQQGRELGARDRAHDHVDQGVTRALPKAELDPAGRRPESKPEPSPARGRRDRGAAPPVASAGRGARAPGSRSALQRGVVGSRQMLQPAAAAAPEMPAGRPAPGGPARGRRAAPRPAVGAPGPRRTRQRSPGSASGTKTRAGRRSRPMPSPAAPSCSIESSTDRRCRAPRGSGGAGTGCSSRRRRSPWRGSTTTRNWPSAGACGRAARAARRGYATWAISPPWAPERAGQARGPPPARPPCARRA